MTCAYFACVRPAYLHGVCADHLATTLAAGRRATLATPRRRMDALIAARYEAA